LAPLSVFAEPEEAMSVPNTHYREKIIKLLEAEDVPFKLGDKDQIYYPKSYHDKINDIFA